jgi:hypothetical protein
VDKLRLVYVPREDATAEGELAASAAIYRFVLQHHEKKKAAEVSEGEEAAERDCTGGIVHKKTEQ